MPENGNGNGHGYAAWAIEVMIVGVVLMLVLGFVVKWLLTETIDSQMYKEVLIFVLGSVTGSMGKTMLQKAVNGSGSGPTIVTPPSGTTVVTPPSGGSVTFKDEKK